MSKQKPGRMSRFIEAHRDKVGDAAFESEVERDAKLCEELNRQLERLITHFATKHPVAQHEVFGPVLLTRAAIILMVGLEFDPDDFAAMAHEVASDCVDDVAKIRAMIKRGGTA